MTRKKEERKVKNAKRKIWLKAGIYPDFSRLCHRSGECLAVPVYYRKIRWGSICIDLFGISGAFGAADHGHVICCRTCKSGKRGDVI